MCIHIGRICVILFSIYDLQSTVFFLFLFKTKKQYFFETTQTYRLKKLQTISVSVYIVCIEFTNIIQMKIVNVWSVLFFLSDFLDFSVFMCVFNNLLFYLLKNMFYVAVLSELCLKYIQELVGLGGKVKMNEIRMRVVAVVCCCCCKSKCECRI